MPRAPVQAFRRAFKDEYAGKHEGLAQKWKHEHYVKTGGCLQEQVQPERPPGFSVSQHEDAGEKRGVEQNIEGEVEKYDFLERARQPQRQNDFERRGKRSVNGMRDRIIGEFSGIPG